MNLAIEFILVKKKLEYSDINVAYLFDTGTPYDMVWDTVRGSG